MHRFKIKFVKNNLLLITVDVSASTEAFVGTACLIAVRRSVSGRINEFNEFYFEIVYRSTYEHIQRKKAPV